jgi:hypothetical protein
MKIPNLSPEAQRRHDQANFETKVMMARGVLAHPLASAAERAIATEVLERIACRLCGCTEFSPCADGCGWAENLGNLCTTCADVASEMAQIAIMWQMTVNSPRPAALVAEVRAAISEAKRDLADQLLVEQAIEGAPLLYAPDGGRLV